jgi:hypothetical protein
MKNLKKIFKEAVIDKVGEVWTKKLRRIYVEDFDKKSLGGLGMNKTKWSPLKPETIKRKKNSRYQYSILKYSGKLRNSIRGVYMKRSSTIKIYTNVEYAKYHDEGAGNLPQRKIFDDLSNQYSDELLEDMEKATELFMYELMKSFAGKNIKVK